MNRGLCWLRRDLRIADHGAFEFATAECDQVLPVFVYDSEILDRLTNRQDRRLMFIHACLAEVKNNLKRSGSNLKILVGDPVEVIPKYAKAVGANTVYASHDDDPYALSRDRAVGDRVQLKTIKDHVVFEKNELLSKSGEPFRVFTPYSKAWIKRLATSEIEPRRWDHRRLMNSSIWARIDPDLDQFPTIDQLGFEQTDLWLAPGEKAAKKQLENFSEQQIEDYSRSRDYIDFEATSGLSVHLRFGTISIRECVRKAISLESEGAKKWLIELIWREFYHSILANFPFVANQSFLPEFREVEWPGDKNLFSLWANGQTGYPLVDAAMRCLKETGWMHNRLRMVVANFLTKDLLLPYQLGESWFAENLLDFELASNNGGWQWSASTGVDAQPWFRIFNPILQSRKFCPDGRFIRKWCPELSRLDNTSIHWPYELGKKGLLASEVVLGETYPYPIVDHIQQRKLALSFFKKVVAKNQ